MKIRIVSLIACVLLLGISNFGSGAAVFNCETKDFHSGHAGHKKKNYVNHGQFLAWKANAPRGTWIVFEFVVKDDADHGGDQGKGESPFADKQPSFDMVVFNPGDKVFRGPARTDAEGKYGYKITCHLPNGDVNVIDPMIEVPK